MFLIFVGVILFFLFVFCLFFVLFFYEKCFNVLYIKFFMLSVNLAGRFKNSKGNLYFTNKLNLQINL